MREIHTGTEIIGIVVNEGERRIREMITDREDR